LNADAPSGALKSGAERDYHGLRKYNPETKTFGRLDLVAKCDESQDLKPTP
jgi:hypothetical protein